MPAATNKTDLLAVFDKELAKLRKTLDGVDEAKASWSAPDDDATIKGVIAHRTHWMGMFHGWYETELRVARFMCPPKATNGTS
ncbi:ClbS/DfsB family four-helix bundle protein [Altererythrobacter endophyticus]|uniref:ClbS/DfsB family four-helix bundle protein n=1 Tax=Altericroceibacterium endophyticum TaxID=1808508 RepID=A0A6I4T0A3_9SPHN|nr:ClbS/DfsB family four-helix bundle protein [Altericroceibacterium endophyticum]MXO64514.1 ClbS/DfsB family four-helix bundle protein [Altericroceibacterium endophyticum]